MSEPITKEWLDRVLGRYVKSAGGVLLDEWWDCGWRFDNGIGSTRVRVLDVGDGDFHAEVGQDVEGAEIKWSAGICLPVKTIDDLRKLCEGLKISTRIGR